MSNEGEALSFRWRELRQRFNARVDQGLLHIWQTLVGALVELGRMSSFFASSIAWWFRRPYRYGEMIRQMEFIGNQSVFIIGLTGIFTGMAMSYQVYLGFKIVNATNLVGPTVALGITRELGPVLTGLIIAARAGGAMAARIGTMRVYEQIDALEVMGVNPKQFLVSPRIIAATLATPLLCAIFDFVSMVGSYIVCVRMLNLDEAIFLDKIGQWLEPRHINEGLFKSAAFGLIFSIVCTYKGFFTEGGAKGVGEATNKGVVLSMVIIIILDYYLTSFIRYYYQLTGM